MDRDNSAAEHNWQTQMQFFNDLQKMLVKLTFIRLYSPFDSQLRWFPARMHSVARCIRN